MEKLINNNNVIDKPIELLILILICLLGIIILFKIANFLESLPVSDKKKKSYKEKKVEITKEIDESSTSKSRNSLDKGAKKNKNYTVEKEFDEGKSKSKKETVIVEKNTAISKEVAVSENNATVTSEMQNGYINNAGPYPYGGGNGYMVPPQMMYYNSAMPPPNYYENNYLYDRFVANPSSEDEILDKPLSDAFISEGDLKQAKEYCPSIKVGNVESVDKKASLHQRIDQMTSCNSDKKERLLKEFEGLSKEMKLLIIENIIQKM